MQQAWKRDIMARAGVDVGRSLEQGLSGKLLYRRGDVEMATSEVLLMWRMTTHRTDDCTE